MFASREVRGTRYAAAMSRWIAVVLCTTACASQMQTLSPYWDGSSEPSCTDSDGAVIGDALAAEAGLGIAQHSSGGAGLIAGILGLGFAVSATVGEEQVERCRAAKAEWHIGTAVAANAQHREARRAAPPPPPPPPPRGYFCTASASRVELGRCTRERDACEQARGLAADAVSDLGPCTLVESATCFAGTCYPSSETCAAHRGPDSVGECAQRR